MLANGREHLTEERIVGGSPTPIDRYPYMAALLEGSHQFCGGVLIAEDWVLSAAHCWGIATHVVIGRSNLGPTNTQVYERIEVDYEIIYPNYKAQTNEHDIMLIKLKRSSSYPPVNYDDGSLALSAGTSLSVMGWGTTCYGGPQSSKLLETEVDVVSNALCNNQYRGLITIDMMCAARAGKDACQGDSGGPIVMKGTNPGEDRIVGIISWGNGCAFPEYPGVYSRVGFHKEWINETLSGAREFSANDRINYNIAHASKRLFRIWNKSRLKKQHGLRNFER